MKHSIIAGFACASLIAGTVATADTKRNAKVSAKRVAHAAGESSTGLNATEVAIILTGITVLAVVLNNGSNGMMSYTTAAASDKRLKTDITRIGTSQSGIPVYSFRYGDAPDVYTGVMAQDLETLAPGALIPLKEGYWAVDYSKIDVDHTVIR